MQYEPNFKTLADLDAQGHLVSKNSETLKIYAAPIFCKGAEYWSNSKMNYNPETNDKVSYILEERPMSTAMFFSFPRFSPFVEVFAKYISRLADCGIWGKIFNRWSSSEEQFETYLSGEERVIKFDDLLSLWILFGTGTLASIGALLIERIINMEFGTLRAKLDQFGGGGEGRFIDRKDNYNRSGCYNNRDGVGSGHPDQQHHLQQELFPQDHLPQNEFPESGCVSLPVGKPLTMMFLSSNTTTSNEW
ncbi:conserved hypothetical protein [Culex quinquefasciatus]|uniref:Ionotropic glutamate receptor C-terminal domain-containing protein n=1 Tax=Culex quinquefasciatus TaxID=7176 RepID=B0WEF4_CULQU|nr:conserved hypothetical protein [Culex quinquefasciatus]|eukprot:XP_001847088.1 conserved hypothetical protein [Culex quinquefasciatus]